MFIFTRELSGNCLLGKKESYPIYRDRLSTSMTIDAERGGIINFYASVLSYDKRPSAADGDIVSAR